MPKKPRQPPLAASASAKIKAKATAKWSRERVAVEFIPPDVTRANSRALLDIFSPITQAAGLVGDRLKHKREMWNLKRELERQKAIEQVAARFDEIRNQSSPPIAPPNKFLYPFIAQASLEEPDSPLIEIWARLLASATDNYDPKYIHFVSVISRLSVRQAKIFNDIVSRAEDSGHLELFMEDVSRIMNSEVREYIDQLFLGRIRWKMQRDGARYPLRHPIDHVRSRRKKLTDNYLTECIVHALNTPIVSYVHAAATNNATDDYWDVEPSELMIYTDDQGVDYAILEACGLLQKVETNMFPVAGGRWSVGVTYYHLTALGQHFAVACRMVHVETATS